MALERHRVVISESAKQMLRSIGKKYGKRVYETLRDLILALEFEPEKKGQPLRGKLHGLYSLHYSRYRVVYKIENDHPVVLVIGAGWHESGSRADIYQVIERLIQAGEVFPDNPDKS